MLARVCCVLRSADLPATVAPRWSSNLRITNEEQLKAAFVSIEKNIGVVHLLVNNAGIVGPGLLCEQETSVWRNMLETNTIALCVATREAVKMMRAHKIAGHIVHINSVAGRIVPYVQKPELSAYPATKHAVTALTECLRQEMNYLKTGIKVTSISPGFVTTEIFDKHETSFSGDIPALIPEDVADAVMYAVGTPPRVQVHELILKPLGEMF